MEPIFFLAPLTIFRLKDLHLFVIIIVWTMKYTPFFEVFFKLETIRTEKSQVHFLLCPVKWKEVLLFGVGRRRHRISCVFKLLLKHRVHLKVLHIKIRAYIY